MSSRENRVTDQVTRAADEGQKQTPTECRASMTWAQRLKRVFGNRMAPQVIHRIYLRLAHYWHWLSDGQYQRVSERVAEVGRLLGGWLKQAASEPPA
jgi:hypothetical protein